MSLGLPQSMPSSDTPTQGYLRYLLAKRTRESGWEFSIYIAKKMENRYGYYRGSGLWRSLRDGDFEEAEVWEVLNGKPESNNTHLWASGERPRSSSSRKHPPTGPKTISRPSGGGGGGSSTPEAAARAVQQSAPVNIPYWSKLQRQKSKKASNSKSTRDWDEEDGAESSDGGAIEGERGESEEDEDEGDCQMPPHELIATRLARRHISSFSVFEGAGRTLKGRDLSKVRHAVLTRTGFLESP